MNKIAPTFWERQGASALSQKDAPPWGSITSQVGVSGCAVGLGAEGASSGRFCFVVQSFIVDPCVSIPLSRPSETIRQQGSKMVSIGRPNLTTGEFSHKNKSTPAN